MLDDTTPSAAFVLEDEEGVFLEVQPDVQEDADLPKYPDSNQEEDNEQEEGGHKDDNQEITRLRKELEEAASENASLKLEVTTLKQNVSDQMARFRAVWHTNCETLSEFDGTKDAELEHLRSLLHESATTSVHDAHESRSVLTEGVDHVRPSGHGTRRGKAPPVDPFTGDSPELRIDDWLPSLERAASWNGWTEEERLIQLAGHLRGRALQEWTLLDRETKKSYERATDALRFRLEPESKTLAAQDFRHTSHNQEEPVADFVRRLERVFNLAYGRDGLSAETRDMLLHGQTETRHNGGTSSVRGTDV